ncbi:MAG: hypothetical protein IRY99_05460 [Isosphaeraceae bacterium]|nr:hypothetical protein [Isosphaeraceae bacterium]
MASATRQEAAEQLPIPEPPLDERYIDLEYHALMGVPGGDEPAHVRSFDRDVADLEAERLRHLRLRLRSEHIPTM